MLEREKILLGESIESLEEKKKRLAQPPDTRCKLERELSSYCCASADSYPIHNYCLYPCIFCFNLQQEDERD